MKIRLADIASEAQVSVATVSNVLRGKGKAGTETEQRVLQVAHRLGYFEQPGRRHSGYLAVVACQSPETAELPEYHPLERTTSFFTLEAIEGIERCLRHEDYQLLFETVGASGALRLPRIVEEQQVAGVLLIGGAVPDEFVLTIADAGIPLVLLYTHVEGESINCVHADNLAASYQAVRWFREQGHERIALLNGLHTTHTSVEKLNGYRKALFELGLEYQPDYVVHCDFTVASGHEGMHALVNLPNRPTAVFAADDIIAAGAVAACHEAGLRVPDDVSIMGFGNGPTALSTSPPLTTMDIPKRTIGELAARRLIDMLSGSADFPLRQILSPRLLIRGSTSRWSKGGSQSVTANTPASR